MQKQPNRPHGKNDATTSKQFAQAEPKLLSGGNPQIPKGDGDVPVQQYIEAMPTWKRAVGKQIDTLVTEHVPEVRKAVRWNSPFYGMPDQGWFLTFHCFTKYVKVAFLNGADLEPPPPIESKDPKTRYLHIFEDEALDEEAFIIWLKQATALPGEHMF